MNLSSIKKIGILLLIIASIFTKTFGQTSTYSTGTAPYSFSFINSGNNTAYTTHYILVNTTTNLITYTSSTTNFSNVAAGVYELFAINYTGTTPTLTVGTDFRNIGGSCITASSYQSMLYVKTGTTSAGTVTSITCGTPSPSTATASTTYTGTATVSYTGGNAGTFITQSIASTGVTGLTVTLAAGTLASGAGSVVYTISGTPSGAGTATFSISLGGQTCSFAVIVNSATTSELAVALTGNSGTVFTVGTSATKSYVFSVKNIGTTTTTSTTLIIGSFTSGYTVTGAGTLTVSTLSPSATQSFTVGVTATSAGAAGSISAIIPTGGGGDINTANNTAGVTFSTTNP